MSDELKILDELISSVNDKDIKRNLKQKKKIFCNQMKEIHRLKKCYDKIIKLSEKKNMEEEKLKTCMKKNILDGESLIASSEEEN